MQSWANVIGVGGGGGGCGTLKQLITPDLTRGTVKHLTTHDLTWEKLNGCKSANVMQYVAVTCSQVTMDTSHDGQHTHSLIWILPFCSELTHSLLCRPKPATRTHVEFSCAGQNRLDINGVGKNLYPPPLRRFLLLLLFWISIVLVNQSKYVFCAYFNELSTPPQSFELSIIFHGGPRMFAERRFRFRCSFWRFRWRNELS